MSIACGIVGLPNVGKSTLFNALTAMQVEVANYPFTTIEPNVSIVPVPDGRLNTLSEIYKPKKVTPAILEFYDIAGLVKGASKGEGLGNQFLSHIRTVNAIIHVVRCFYDENVAHIGGSVDPKRDIEVVETELLLKDLGTVEKKLEATEKKAKGGDKKIKEEMEIYRRLHKHLVSGNPTRSFTAADNELSSIKDLYLLSAKPVLYVANVDEQQYMQEDELVRGVRETAQKENAPVIIVCSKLESEVLELSPEERTAFLEDLGIKESALNLVIHESYRLLDLITFFTCNPNEVRARSIKRGSTAYDAAGDVHTDFQEGFIKADVMRVENLVEHGSEHVLREKGLISVYGRDYIVKDGDIIFFRAHH